MEGHLLLADSVGVREKDWVLGQLGVRVWDSVAVRVTTAEAVGVWVWVAVGTAVLLGLRLRL